MVEVVLERVLNTRPLRSATPTLLLKIYTTNSDSLIKGNQTFEAKKTWRLVWQDMHFLKDL